MALTLIRSRTASNDPTVTAFHRDKEVQTQHQSIDHNDMQVSVSVMESPQNFLDRPYKPM
jgi:hypothetical protein